MLRLRKTSTRMGIDPAPIERQARAWRYARADLDEMLMWPPHIVEMHVRLLMSEIAEGFFP